MTNPTSDRSYRWLFWLLALVGFGVDQASKYGVFASLYDKDTLEGSIVVIPETFSIVARFTSVKETGNSPLAFLRTLSAEHLPEVNKGALFGTKLYFSPETANFVFTIVSVLAAVGITIWSTRPSTAPHGYLCFALGLILAGTLGNLYDRLVFGGVRDFLWWYKGVNWPVFNFADCWLVCGASLLLLEAFFAKSEPAQQPAEVVAATNVNGV